MHILKTKLDQQSHREFSSVVDDGHAILSNRPGQNSRVDNQCVEEISVGHPGKISISELSDQTLIANFSLVVKTERKITHQVLRYLLEIEDRKLHLKLGFESLYSFLIKQHGYSGGSAQRRIQSARLLRECPGLGAKIESGRVNLTQLNQAQMMLKQAEVINQEKISVARKEEILAGLESKTTFETEVYLSQQLDMPIVQTEVVRAQKDESSRIEFTASKELLGKLEEVRNIFSHVKHNPSFAELLEMLMDFAIKKTSPAREVRTYAKAKARAHKKTARSDGKNKARGDQTRPVGQKVPAENLRCFDLSRDGEGTEHLGIVTHPHAATVRRSPIPPDLKRQILRRQNCCQYKSAVTGIRCGSKFQLQVDHIVPVARGGTNDLENLRALCREHNLLEAERWGLYRPKFREFPGHP